MAGRFPKKFLHTLALAAPLLFAIPGCEDEAVESKLALLNTSDYFPLHLGDYWKLSVLGERSIQLTAEIDNKEYFGVVSLIDTIYFRKSDDGKVFQRTKDTPEQLTFDFTAEEGDTWLFKEVPSDYSWYVTLLSKDDTVTVGDYRFLNCHRYLFDIPQMADDERVVWLAPGVGIIEEYFPGGTADRKVLTNAKIDGVEFKL